MEQKTKIDVPDGGQELVITREFNLPVELLYKAYAEAGFVAQWMGTKVLKLEHRNHGGYEFETSHEGKVVFKANGTIHKVVPNQQIIRTFEMENLPSSVHLEFLEFEKLTNDTSKLTIQMIYKSEEHRAEQLKLPFAYGLNLAHNRLEEILKNLK
ncbi:SRPBCC domain-containing protein [Flagellimonas halotolerans]|uniref:SRPBCC domain-containing protein n=1 Tax=Flagellimonas halotolerans TaxID=3112164 RepID=A0ABU6IRJ0_9FLAO|nr:MULTISPECIES: SRPBCC domain-containing protein [unclassified Allomuricauda]MEC3965848.1 SRPBCC domain-containing protein [Muricauda sp. SYSU M86414]MEC4265686.1 SRPBCC domain-containing protein [Muricauda sp. SYSU M84420]